MTCLIIDTSTDLCLIALINGNQILTDRVFPHFNMLSKNLLTSVQDLLSQHRVTTNELNYIAVGIGPGSYTGTRVGATVAKSLAFGLNIMVKPFCSPLAFLPNQNGSFAFLLPTRTGEYFVIQGTCWSDTTVQKCASLLSPDALSTELRNVDFIISPSTHPLPDALKEKLCFEPSINLPVLIRHLSTVQPLLPENVELQYLHTPYHTSSSAKDQGAGN